MAEVKSGTPRFGRERCKPGQYNLDLSLIKDAPLKINGAPSTLDALYIKFVEAKTIEISDDCGLREAKFVTDKGDLVVEAEEWQLISLINRFAELFKRGINPYNVRWFYFDHDWSRDGDEVHVFFAVHGSEIVLDSCHFGSDDALILKQGKDYDPIWHSHPYFDEALVQYWYGRFYTETLTGKLMVLRPDEPLLYYFPRPAVRDNIRDLSFVTLIKLYRLGWVAVALLVAIAFPAFKEIMAVIAIVLLIDVLWRAWATRKIGTSD